MKNSDVWCFPGSWTGGNHNLTYFVFLKMINLPLVKKNWNRKSFSGRENKEQFINKPTTKKGLTERDRLQEQEGKGKAPGSKVILHCSWKWRRERSLSFQILLYLEVLWCLLRYTRAIKWKLELHSRMYKTEKKVGLIQNKPKSMIKHVNNSMVKYSRRQEYWKRTMFPAFPVILGMDTLIKYKC